MASESVDHDYALRVVPEEGKKNFFSMFAVMLGFTFFSASMWTGGALGTGLTASEFIIAVICGNLVLGVYTVLLANMACKTGLSTHLLAEYSFGEKGSYLVSSILGITQVGWFGVGVAMFAYPLQKLTGWPLWPIVIVAGFCMTATAFFGIKALTILSIIAVPSIAILGSTSVCLGVKEVGGLDALFALEHAESLPMTVAISMCIGSFISGGTLTPDFARFAKTRKIGISTTLIAFFIGNSLMFIFGAVGAAVYNKADISDVMMLQGLIIPAVIVLGLNIWTTNDNALYASSLGFSNITKMSKNKLVIINGFLGTVFAISLYNNFVGWLNILNTLIPSTGAIMLAHFYLVKKQQYEDFAKKQFKAVNINAIIAWVLGVISGSFITIGIAPLNGVVVASATFIILTKLNSQKDSSYVDKECNSTR